MSQPVKRTCKSVIQGSLLGHVQLVSSLADFWGQPGREKEACEPGVGREPVVPGPVLRRSVGPASGFQGGQRSGLREKHPVRQEKLQPGDLGVGVAGSRAAPGLHTDAPNFAGGGPHSLQGDAARTVRAGSPGASTVADLDVHERRSWQVVSVVQPDAKCDWTSVNMMSRGGYCARLQDVAASGRACGVDAGEAHRTTKGCRGGQARIRHCVRGPAVRGEGVGFPPRSGTWRIARATFREALAARAFVCQVAEPTVKQGAAGRGFASPQCNRLQGGALTCLRCAP